MDIGILLILISLCIAVVILAMTPYLTRRTENFGVTIPEKMYYRNDFKNMRKQYVILTSICGGFITILNIFTFFFFTSNIAYIIATISIFIILILGFGIYLKYHFQMKKIKENENWYQDKPQSIMVDMKFRNEKLTHSNWWFLIPGIIIIATIALTFLLYDQIPYQIPMHTDFAGNVRYDEKSITNLLFLPGTQVFMLILFLVINIIIKNAKQQVSAESPDKSRQQNILFRRKWSLYMIIFAIIIQLMFSYMQFGFIYPVLNQYDDIVIGICTAIILIGAIFLSIKTGQGGSRIKVESSSENNQFNRDDDRYWKLGQFYVNKNDPAIFVEKRFGIGWTNNWAHPLSWVFIIAIIAIPIIMTIIFI